MPDTRPSPSPATGAPPALRIERATAHVLFAYDIGLAIDLDAAMRRITAALQREKLEHKRRTPRTFEFTPGPLRVTEPAEPIPIASFRTTASVTAVLYDFGAISVTYEIPFEGGLDELQRLSESLYDNAALLADSRRRVEGLLDMIRDAIGRPAIAAFVEDYCIIQIAEWSGAPASSGRTAPGDLLDAQHGAFAQVLRADPQPLSDQEIADALSSRIAYGRNDLVVIDWNAALIFDTDADDVRTVLEFANVELLEMRFLDAQLDRALDESYVAISRRTWRGRRMPGTRAADLRKVAQLQVDSAVLFEGVNNTLKLLGDQYLARVYRLASQRFHLADWDASIIRKLGTLDSIYQKMSDDHAAWRIEVLEWIIILLFVVDIIISIVPGIVRH